MTRFRIRQMSSGKNWTGAGPLCRWAWEKNGSSLGRLTPTAQRRRRRHADEPQQDPCARAITRRGRAHVRDRRAAWADGLGHLVRDLVRVSLAEATIRSGRHYVRIGGIVVTLTGAASALDDTFGTTLFKAGLELGTASTLLRF